MLLKYITPLYTQYILSHRLTDTNIDFLSMTYNTNVRCKKTNIGRTGQRLKRTESKSFRILKTFGL